MKKNRKKLAAGIIAVAAAGGICLAIWMAGQKTKQEVQEASTEATSEVQESDQSSIFSTGVAVYSPAGGSYVADKKMVDDYEQITLYEKSDTKLTNPLLIVTYDKYAMANTHAANFAQNTAWILNNLGGQATSDTASSISPGEDAQELTKDKVSSADIKNVGETDAYYYQITEDTQTYVITIGVKGSEECYSLVMSSAMPELFVTDPLYYMLCQIGTQTGLDQTKTEAAAQEAVLAMFPDLEPIDATTESAEESSTTNASEVK